MADYPETPLPLAATNVSQDGGGWAALNGVLSLRAEKSTQLYTPFVGYAILAESEQVVAYATWAEPFTFTTPGQVLRVSYCVWALSPGGGNV